MINMYKCNNHKETLEFFCLTCEEPICNLCFKLGPHQNKLHRCISLKEAVEKRRNFIVEILSNEYKKKIEKIIDHMQALRFKGEEVSTIENVIENDIHYEFNGIFDRLSREEGKKISILQKEISFLQRDVNNIDDLIDSFAEVMQKKDPVNFLLICKEIWAYAENLHAKSFKKSVDEYPYDLPREASDVKIQMNNQTTLKLLNEFKNDVIYKIIKRNKDDDLLKIKDFIPEKLVELNGWVRLSENFANEFSQYQLVCFYCSELLTESNINSNCYINRMDFDMPKNFKGCTEKIPKFKHRGNDRHYFHKPKKELLQIKQNVTPALNDQSSSEKLYDNLFSIFKVEIFKIYKLCFEEEMKIRSIFEELDKEKKGKLKPIQFKYLLSEKFNLENDEIEKITSFFSDKNNLIPYMELVDIIENFEKNEVKPEVKPLEKDFKTTTRNYYSPMKNEDSFSYGYNRNAGRSNDTNSYSNYYGKY